jgi:UDP-glucose 4-epimerase
MLSGKTVFVTGGAGFIGSHLVDASLAHGAARVIVLDNFTGGRLENLEHLRGDDRVSVTTGDVREMDTVAPLVAAADVIFHEAASKMIVSESHPRVDLETNIVGTFNLLQCLRGTEKVLLHASTGSVLGNSVEGEMQEDHPRNPSTLYGISKGCAEGYVQFYAREFGVNAGIFMYAARDSLMMAKPEWSAFFLDESCVACRRSLMVQASKFAVLHTLWMM